MPSTITTHNQQSSPGGSVPSVAASELGERRPLSAAAASSELLFARCRGGDRAAREALVTRYMPLARKLARRYWSSSLSAEDLTQVANLALVKAVDRFDPDRARTFEAFAIPTILGELRRHFRDASWAVHVARGAQERSKAIHDATARLSREHGRPPTVGQLAQYLELSEEEVLDGLRVSYAYAASSLDAPVQDGEEEETTLGSTLGAHDQGYEQVENGILVADALANLTAREQRLLELRFVHELTQAQIGEQLGVSQMQVSRLLRSSLATLRESIGETAEL
jgi:RNA polymerase sigma-B factor